MKKVILMSALVVLLASCSSSVAPEATPAVDSTCVKTDTACTVKCDSAAVATATSPIATVTAPTTFTK